MINYLNVVRRSQLAMGIFAALLVTSQGVMAGQYHSRVDFPYTYSSGITHKIFIPFDRNAPDGIKIKSVSWSWGRHMNHQSYSVQLCQVLLDVCRNVSHEKNGSTTIFNF